MTKELEEAKAHLQRGVDGVKAQMVAWVEAGRAPKDFMVPVCYVPFSFAEALLSALSRGDGAPEGWVLVPKEPTGEMVRRAKPWLEHLHHMRANDKANAIAEAYAAMIAAAPPVPEGEE